MIARLSRWIARAIIVFIAYSLVVVVLLRFVPVTWTVTMLLDPHPISRQWEPLSRIDRSMVTAAIAAEDDRFCSHHGFDTHAIETAIKQHAQGRRLRGASTISQQTAKNVFLWQGGGWLRKGLEAWFTVLIERIWGKRRIMEVYLNVAQTGIGTYGVEAGAERYFHRSAAHLTPEQASRIAAVLPNPDERRAIDPQGFTRRYGVIIRDRMAVVRRDGLAVCVYK